MVCPRFTGKQNRLRDECFYISKESRELQWKGLKGFIKKNEKITSGPMWLNCETKIIDSGYLTYGARNKRQMTGLYVLRSGLPNV